MINCTITSPEKTTRYGKLSGITLPAASGQAQILPGHAETFMLVKKGNIVLRQPGQKEVMQIPSAVFYIKNNKAVFVL